MYQMLNFQSENKNETLSTIKNANTLTKPISESWLLEFVINTGKPVEKNAKYSERIETTLHLIKYLKSVRFAGLFTETFEFNRICRDLKILEK